ncbi:MAG: nucleotidyltransferase domain-containing protein [Phascolarctobacterium sp.]|uniref:nucleotidyltransferase domain-containing protein n=1 Tax=Phascolarctobacterium sp. TaxID=2049039 RepID=UPI0026DCA681|nr:nucleotidyltransferase domain-containing protein [Phascolarctobacterium sp.]MDO4920458.1 nucleotidyltransferase domain-containing protein [Phascolarctobacterium sp.]
MCTGQDLFNIAEEIKQEALKMCPDIEKIILYGSYARGDNTFDSDMDIMIVINDTQENVKKYRKQFSVIAASVGMKYDVLLSVLFRDKTNFEEKAKYMPFYQNVIKEGIEWYGRAA